MTGSATIDQLIINSPYEEPREHWRYYRETRLFTREPERRKAGYIRASESSRSFDDPGIFVELPLVNQIRPRIKAWRETDYPGATGITKRLLQHWRDPEQRDSNRRFFFCHLEAIETLIWLAEAPASERVGIEIPGDTGPFTRLCCKMATGSGKTILMSMLIAWQVLNKVTYAQDKRYSKNVLLVAPGLTVKNRLQVLIPGSAGNFYTEFQIIPPGLEDKLRQGSTCRVHILNWHKLDWETVTHVMGLRAFTSQLLCEQVVGRGLRRTSYDTDEKTGLFQAEYVNIFGVPFTFLPHEGGGDEPPPPPPAPKTRIEAMPVRKSYEIVWPNVVRIDHEYRPTLALDLNKAKPLVLDAYLSPTLAELAPIIDGKPHERERAEIRLRELDEQYRIQKVMFTTAGDIYEQMKTTWKGNREYLLAQIIRIVERYIQSDKLKVDPPLFNNDDLRRRIVIALQMSAVAEHIKQAIDFENKQTLIPIFDTERPIRATGDMLPWYTGKPCEHTKRSHINMSVFDSRWEASEAFELDRNDNVVAWVRTTTLGSRSRIPSGASSENSDPTASFVLQMGRC